MALRITRAADPITVDRLNVVVYGPPGLGKTSLAFTAEAPLLLDFDNGSHRAAGRKDVVRVASWSDVVGITQEDLAPYSTIVIDTAGRALDAITADIIKTDPKGHKNGSLTLPGYGTLKSRFTGFMKLMNSFGKDVVLIAHMDEQRNGDDVIERLDVQGGSKGEIYKAADAMGRLVMEGGKRYLKFSPADAAFGKNPGQLEPLLVPHNDATEFDDFLARIIAGTKDRLNAMSEDQKAAKQAQDALREALAGASDAVGINALLDQAKAAGPVAKSMLHARATELGMVFDKAAGAYAVKPAEGNQQDAA